MVSREGLGVVNRREVEDRDEGVDGEGDAEAITDIERIAEGEEVDAITTKDGGLNEIGSREGRECGASHELITANVVDKAIVAKELVSNGTGGGQVSVEVGGEVGGEVITVKEMIGALVRTGDLHRRNRQQSIYL